MFFFVFHKMQSKKSTSKDEVRERQKNKSNRKRKTNSVWLCLILPKCAGSVNCARADRVTSSIYRAHFRFLEMLKETQFFLKSSLFLTDFDENQRWKHSYAFFFQNHAFSRKLPAF